MKVEEGRVIKYMNFQTRLEAESHLESHFDNYPEAFVVETPNAPVDYWLINNGAVSISAPLSALPYQNVESAIASLIEWTENFTISITGPRPEAEKLSWLMKGPAARAYLSGTANSSQKKMIEIEAVITGENPDDLANTIVTKADIFETIAIQIAGIRRKTENALTTAEPEMYETILLAAKEEVTEAAKKIGAV